MGTLRDLDHAVGTRLGSSTAGAASRRPLMFVVAVACLVCLSSGVRPSGTDPDIGEYLATQTESQEAWVRNRQLISESSGNLWLHYPVCLSEEGRKALRERVGFFPPLGPRAGLNDAPTRRALYREALIVAVMQPRLSAETAAGADLREAILYVTEEVSGGTDALAGFADVLGEALHFYKVGWDLPANVAGTLQLPQAGRFVMGRDELLDTARILKTRANYSAFADRLDRLGSLLKLAKYGAEVNARWVAATLMHLSANDLAEERLQILKELLGSSQDTALVEALDDVAVVVSESRKSIESAFVNGIGRDPSTVVDALRDLSELALNALAGSKIAWIAATAGKAINSLDAAVKSAKGLGGAFAWWLSYDLLRNDIWGPLDTYAHLTCLASLERAIFTSSAREGVDTRSLAQMRRQLLAQQARAALGHEYFTDLASLVGNRGWIQSAIDSLVGRSDDWYRIAREADEEAGRCYDGYVLMSRLFAQLSQAAEEPECDTSRLVIVAVDASASMEQQVSASEIKYAAAEKALVRMVGALRGMGLPVTQETEATHQLAETAGLPPMIAVISYASSARLVLPATGKYAAVQNLVQQGAFRPRDNTNYMAALEQALALAKDDLQVSIILVSDGVPTESSTQARDMVSDMFRVLAGQAPTDLFESLKQEVLDGPVRTCAQRHIPIHTVGVYPDDAANISPLNPVDRDPNFLQSIASATGGQYVHVGNIEQLGTMFVKALQHASGLRTVLESAGTIQQDEMLEYDMHVPGGVSEIHGAVSYPGSRVSVIFRTPKGDIEGGGAALGINYLVVRNPIPGPWTVAVRGDDLPPGGEPFVLTVALPQGGMPAEVAVWLLTMVFLSGTLLVVAAVKRQMAWRHMEKVQP